MKILLVITCCLLPSFAFAGGDSWYKPAPASLYKAKPDASIPPESFFEVSASKEATAEYWLAEKSVIPQKQNDFSFFGQHNFQCANSMHAYLVRAVYENGGTGAFDIRRLGSTLLISHGSLGAPSGMHRTALVICLDFEPTEIFHALSGAM